MVQRREQLIDAGIALAVFAGTLGLLALGNHAESELDAVSIVLAAAASLPLLVLPGARASAAALRPPPVAAGRVRRHRTREQRADVRRESRRPAAGADA